MSLQVNVILRCWGLKTGRVLSSVPIPKVKETRASLAALTRVNGKRATLHILGTSGTVKRVTEKFLQNHKVFEPKIEIKSRTTEE